MGAIDQFEIIEPNKPTGFFIDNTLSTTEYAGDGLLGQVHGTISRWVVMIEFWACAILLCLVVYSFYRIWRRGKVPTRQ